MIKFENITKAYPPNTIALNKVSFQVEKGEFLLVVGKSGAGKTTLFKILTLEEKPNLGKVYYNNEDIFQIPASKVSLHRKKIGVVYQEYRLLPNLNVYENVAWAMMVSGKPDSEISKGVNEALKIVDLNSKTDKFPYQLSSGEKQRLSIARAIINNPEILLADEPTGNLDCYFSLEIAHLLDKINSLGTTVILTTHDRDLVNNFRTRRRIVALENGRLIRDDREGRFIF